MQMNETLGRQRETPPAMNLTNRKRLDFDTEVFEQSIEKHGFMVAESE